MRWIKPNLRNSISAFLGSDARRVPPPSLEAVRQAMLSTLGDDGAELNPGLKHRLLYLHDAHGLWFARAEMMAVLSALRGESQAVDALKNLTPAFEGLIPDSLMASTRVGRREVRG